MASYEITLTPLIALGIVLFFGGIGFFLKKRQIAKDRKLFNQYDKEMVLNHADILELQKDYIILEMKMRELSIPVIPISTPVKEVTVQETDNTPVDTSARKKLLNIEKLSKENTLRSSF
ncbi:MAG: hypothetical protein P4L51_26285 [Puia sp.]|nr:hypothetical protein [Puia sp.]